MSTELEKTRNKINILANIITVILYLTIPEVIIFTIGVFIKSSALMGIMLAALLIGVGIAFLMALRMKNLSQKESEIDKQERMKRYYEESHKDVVERYNINATKRAVQNYQNRINNRNESFGQEFNNQYAGRSNSFEQEYNDQMNRFAKDSMRSVTPFEMGGTNTSFGNSFEQEYNDQMNRFAEDSIRSVTPFEMGGTNTAFGNSFNNPNNMF